MSIIGYFTSYALNLSGVESDQHERLAREIDKLAVFVNGSIDEGFYAYDKWYDFDQDMLLLSSRFPNVLFTLLGKGDSDDDYWMNYYKGGQAQYGAIEIVYHEFDERKLAGDPVEDAGQAYSYEQKEVGA